MHLADIPATAKRRRDRGGEGSRGSGVAVDEGGVGAPMTWLRGVGAPMLCVRSAPVPIACALGVIEDLLPVHGPREALVEERASDARLVDLPVKPGDEGAHLALIDGARALFFGEFVEHVAIGRGLNTGTKRGSVDG